MTGLGVYRQLKSRGLVPKAFVDSDIAFRGHRVCGLPVLSPKDFELKVDGTSVAIVIAVALKSREITSSLSKTILKNSLIFDVLCAESPTYTIDILGACNLKCASCPHSIEEHDTPKGFMSLENYKKVLDKVLLENPEIAHISLYSWGEPLLHPQIDEVIEYAHLKNIAVAVSSNLSIKFEDRLDSLIKAGPDYLKVSVSGYFPDAYNNTHQGGDINLVKANLYKIRYLLDKYKSNTIVDINYHLYKDNSGKNLLKFKELANELNFIISESYALVMPLERVLNYLDGMPDAQVDKLQENLLVTIEEGIEASSKGVEPSTSCTFRDNQVNINADLTVPVCCTVFHRKGNIIAQNFLESTKEEVSQGKLNANICAKCMELRLPEYNLGFNRLEWDHFASQKLISD
jgi:MoaA/NifB/PqqE/SkfB family radical SAM enzyme